MDAFNKNYQDKMLAYNRKRALQQEERAREEFNNVTFTPAINKNSRKIMETGGVPI